MDLIVLGDSMTEVLRGTMLSLPCNETELRLDCKRCAQGWNLRVPVQSMPDGVLQCCRQPQSNVGYNPNLPHPPCSLPGVFRRQFGQHSFSVQSVAGDRVESLIWRMEHGSLPTLHQVCLCLRWPHA